MDASKSKSPADRLHNGSEIRFIDAAPFLEIACWIALAMAPLLRYVNGPAVSTDQLVTQITAVCIAASGAIGLRVYNWRRREPSLPSEEVAKGDREPGRA
jgi:hypothetical protein